MNSWLPSGERLHTAHPRQQSLVFQLLVDVAGFKDALMSAHASLDNPIGYVSFVFSVKCATKDCAFVFAEVRCR